MNPPRVKICGITKPIDAELAIRQGAFAIGLNFFSKSPRYIDWRDAAERLWMTELKRFPVIRVGVLVNPSLEECHAVWTSDIVDVLQLHGDETPEFLDQLAGSGIATWKAIRVREGQSSASLAEVINEYKVSTIVLDAFTPDAFGGTGRTFDWKIVKEMQKRIPEKKFILSGGLTAENVVEAIRQTEPYAVDVASGVESEDKPRRKDESKLRQFIKAACMYGQSRVPPTPR